MPRVVLHRNQRISEAWDKKRAGYAGPALNGISTVSGFNGHGGTGSAFKTCQWIEGEARADAPKCGDNTVAGTSYCDAHLARAYRRGPEK